MFVSMCVTRVIMPSDAIVLSSCGSILGVRQAAAPRLSTLRRRGLLYVGF